MRNFYITTTLPYVNADPHIGFAMEIIRADTLARYRRAQGDAVFFNTGTDEHGQKIYEKACATGKDPKQYCDEWAEKFRTLKGLLNVSVDNFIRTTDAHHEMAAQEFWRRCAAAGDIYKKNYLTKYCVGCELQKTDSELVEGKCAIHPNLVLQETEEENYFFRFSKYQERLLELYDSRPEFVLPPSRLGEIRAFVSRGLEDFSISRLASKMPWGVPVPDDHEQVMYVWFDALVNYISAIGFPDDGGRLNDWWPGMQIAGKDNLRPQAAMWQAMLMSAGLPPSRQIWIEGFITSGGQKMSKSMGNVVAPADIVERYGADALRYYLIRHIPPFEDGDFTEDKFKEAYNANLANGLGNLVSRVLRMAENYLIHESRIMNHGKYGKLEEEYRKYMDSFEFNKAADMAWGLIGELDAEIQKTEPYKLIKTDPEKAREIIAGLVGGVTEVAKLIEPMLPATAQKIKDAIAANKMPEPLFVRK